MTCLFALRAWRRLVVRVWLIVTLAPALVGVSEPADAQSFDGITVV